MKGLMLLLVFLAIPVRAQEISPSATATGIQSPGSPQTLTSPASQATSATPTPAPAPATTTTATINPTTSDTAVPNSVPVATTPTTPTTPSTTPDTAIPNSSSTTNQTAPQAQELPSTGPTNQTAPAPVGLPSIGPSVLLNTPSSNILLKNFITPSSVFKVAGPTSLDQQPIPLDNGRQTLDEINTAPTPIPDDSSLIFTPPSQPLRQAQEAPVNTRPHPNDTEIVPGNITGGASGGKASGTSPINKFP